MQFCSVGTWVDEKREWPVAILFVIRMKAPSHLVDFFCSNITSVGLTSVQSTTIEECVEKFNSLLFLTRRKASHKKSMSRTNPTANRDSSAGWCWRVEQMWCAISPKLMTAYQRRLMFRWIVRKSRLSDDVASSLQVLESRNMVIAFPLLIKLCSIPVSERVVMCPRGLRNIINSCESVSGKCSIIFRAICGNELGKNIWTETIWTVMKLLIYHSEGAFTSSDKIQASPECACFENEKLMKKLGDIANLMPEDIISIRIEME